jgi:hypothetical protein
MYRASQLVVLKTVNEIPLVHSAIPMGKENKAGG